MHRQYLEVFLGILLKELPLYERGCVYEGELSSEVFHIFFFFVFLPFLGPLPRHMEVPRLGVQSEL